MKQKLTALLLVLLLAVFVRTGAKNMKHENIMG